MSKFETIGTQYQLEARSITDANRSLDYSCNACCHSMRALHCDCDHCAIQMTHKEVVAYFNDNPTLALTI
jgi:hypothetical protein